MTNTRLRALTVVTAVMAAFITVPTAMQPIKAVAAASPMTITTAYTTGYTYFDNSPPGMAICCGVTHQTAGGMGTYSDPITLAAGLVSSSVLDYQAGTRFYMSDLHRYFIVEDSCGSVGTGCHVLTNAPPGATTWVDMWVGGTAGDSQTAAQACSSKVTDSDTRLHTIIENPPTNLPVVAGPLFQNGQCTALYGNGTPTPTPTPTPMPTPTPAPLPFKGLYTLEGFGGIHADSSQPLGGTAYWPGWKIARVAKTLPVTSGSPQTGFVLDGYGGLHSFGAPLNETNGSGHRWGWDIARDFAFLPNGTGGYVLDGFGGLHPFAVNGGTAPPAAVGAPYWGWDIARKVVIFSDGSGGYVLDGWGGLHPFGINGPTPVSAASLAGGGYWPGWDIAHDIVLVPGNGGRSGYVLDGFGGLHPFHPQDGSTMPASISSAYWGWDIARTVWLSPTSTALSPAGYVLDGYGGLHPIGPVPIPDHPYWGGWDIAVGLAGQ